MSKFSLTFWFNRVCHDRFDVCCSIPFYLLWNWLIPPIFGLPKITLVQGFGLWMFLLLIRNTKFDFKQTMENIKSQQHKDAEVEWNQVFDSVKKKLCG